MAVIAEANTPSSQNVGNYVAQQQAITDAKSNIFMHPAVAAAISKANANNNASLNTNANGNKNSSSITRSFGGDDSMAG